MVMLALVRVAAGSAPAPLLPDLNARFIRPTRRRGRFFLF